MKDLEKIKALVIKHTKLDINNNGVFDRHTTSARYIYYFLCKKYTHFSDTAIADSVDLNRVTVFKALQIFDERMRWEPLLMKVMQDIETILQKEYRNMQPRVNSIITMLSRTDAETVDKIHKMLRKERREKLKELNTSEC